MVKKKFKFKYELADIFEDYCWIVGLSLIVGGLLLFVNDPISIFIAGLIVAGVGAFLKGKKRK